MREIERGLSPPGLLRPGEDDWGLKFITVLSGDEDLDPELSNCGGRRGWRNVAVGLGEAKGG